MNRIGFPIQFNPIQSNLIQVFNPNSNLFKPNFKIQIIPTSDQLRLEIYFILIQYRIDWALSLKLTRNESDLVRLIFNQLESNKIQKVCPNDSETDCGTAEDPWGKSLCVFSLISVATEWQLQFGLDRP